MRISLADSAHLLVSVSSSEPGGYRSPCAGLYAVDDVRVGFKVLIKQVQMPSFGAEKMIPLVHTTPLQLEVLPISVCGRAQILNIRHGHTHKEALSDNPNSLATITPLYVCLWVLCCLLSLSFSQPAIHDGTHNTLSRISSHQPPLKKWQVVAFWGVNWRLWHERPSSQQCCCCFETSQVGYITYTAVRTYERLAYVVLLYATPENNKRQIQRNRVFLDQGVEQKNPIFRAVCARNTEHVGHLLRHKKHTQQQYIVDSVVFS